MAKLDLVGAGYLGRSSLINASRCINFYPELSSPDSKNVSALVGTPGTKLFADTLLGSGRGGHFFNNLIYFVAGDKLYSVDSAQNVFPIMDTATGKQVKLATSIGRVSMADNGMYSTDGSVGNQLAFVDGINLYVYNVTTGVLFSAAVPAKTIVFIGGYFLMDQGGSKLGISALYDGTQPNGGGTYPGLAISAADAYPDNLNAVINNHNEAWLIGEASTEIWYADGSSNPIPFSRSAVIDYGTSAPYSVSKGSNTIFWLVSQHDGDSGEVLGVAMANGYGVDIISPPSINYQISQYPIVSDAWGYCFTESGHEFYRITFPTANATWQYDATTKLWSEVSYYSGSLYAIGRHLANFYVYAWGNHYIGSYLDGKIYEMSEKYLDDDGVPISSVRISPPMNDKNSDAYQFVSKVQVEMETGVDSGVDTWDVSNMISVILEKDDGVARVAFSMTRTWDRVFAPILLTTTGYVSQDTQTLLGNIKSIWGYFVTAWLMDVDDPSKGILIRGNQPINLAIANYDVFTAYAVQKIFSKNSTPQAFLSWSTDGGKTWSNDHAASVGGPGQYRKRIIWRRPGAARNRTWRFAVSEPIKKIVVDALIDLEAGAY